MNNPLIEKAYKDGKGVLLMSPNWVPRTLYVPGRRLRLYPDEYCPLGIKRGYICERWFSATAGAENGPDAPEDEGLSYVFTGRDKIQFRDFVSVLGPELIGEELWQQYGRWPMFAKFYDYKHTFYQHLHPKDEDAVRVGRPGKPEAYYFPPEMNLSLDSAPVTYFGFDPSVRKEEIIERLNLFETRDNKLTELSRGFRLELGTGWYTPPGVLHACGSLCTYEPQWMSVAGSFWENQAPGGPAVPVGKLSGHVPEDKKLDLEYLYSLMDVEANFDANYRKKYFRRPIPEVKNEQYMQNWITYGNPYIGAKELRIQAGQTATIKDQAAYGCILIQGYGKFGPHHAESPNAIHYGEQTYDEFFVSEGAAREGIVVENHSRQELVMLKHFCHNAGAPTAEI